MTPECLGFIETCVGEIPNIRGNVLEVGSYNVNGSPRSLLSDRERFPSYVGVDMRPGPDVDAVMNVQALAFDDASFDVIVDAERLEHDNKFWISYRELYRVAKPGCFLIITTRSWGGFPPHDYPHDYWRFMGDGLRSLLEDSGFRCLTTVSGEVSSAGPTAIFAVGCKA